MRPYGGLYPLRNILAATTAILHRVSCTEVRKSSLVHRGHQNYDS